MKRQICKMIVIVFGILLTSSCRDFDINPTENAQNLGDAKAERWIDVQSIGFELLQDKQDITLSDETTKLIFLDQYPGFHPNWESIVNEKSELAPDAKELPQDDQFLQLFMASSDDPFAQVFRYSKNVIIVKLLRPKGAYLWHHYYECLASFEIRRTPEIDNLFDIQTYEKTYGREYKGLKQGSSPQDVTEAMGEPPKTDYSQAVGFYSWYYPSENITIVFQNELVKEIRDGIP